MFTIAQTIAKRWEQPECLSTGEQANRGPSAQRGTPQPWQGVRCQHTLQHGRTREATEYVIPLTQNVQKRQIHRQKAGAGGGGGECQLAGSGFLWGDENVLEPDRDVGCTTL